MDVLVNNAAGNFVVKAEELSPNGWRAVVSIVLDGGFLCSRAAGKQMIEQGDGGAILSVIASYAWTGGPGTVHSAAAKAGLIGMTKTVSHEVARRGITVNAVAPGFIETDMTKDLVADVVKAIPARRAGQPEDVAAAVRFLASDDAAYVTGTTLFVDGGMSA